MMSQSTKSVDIGKYIRYKSELLIIFVILTSLQDQCVWPYVPHGDEEDN